MTTGNTDVDTLAAEPGVLTLVSGQQIQVERLRTRALMGLLKILTRGAAEALPSLRFDADTSAEEFAGQLLGAVVLAIPEAEDEVIAFLQRMVTPVGLVESRRLSKADAEANFLLEEQLRTEMDDPDPSDTVQIIQRIIEVESPHILALGKQLGVLIKAQQTSATAKQGSSSRRSSKA